MGLLDRLKARLGKTRAAISDNLSGLFRGGRKIDQALLDELEELLYTSDLGPMAGELTTELARLHKRGELKGEEDVRVCLRDTPAQATQRGRTRRENVQGALPPSF